MKANMKAGMKAPRRAAALAPARPAPRHAAPGPLIRITVTVELPGRLTMLLTAAAAALMHLLRHG